MSRLIRFHQFGDADVLCCEEQPQRPLAAHEVRVRVQAIGVSWNDVLWRRNQALAQVHLPAGLGTEMAGVVHAVGEAVDDLQPGERVASFTAMSPNDYPVCGEQVIVPRNALTRYPECLTPVEASVHYSSMLLAWFAYVELAGIRAGQTVLVTDAAYSPATAFVQMGKALGARVIAATRSADDRDYLMANGAESVIVCDEQDPILRCNAMTCGRGLDAVFDGTGGMHMPLLADTLAPRGALVLYGLRGGNDTPFPATEAFRRNIRFFVHCLDNFTGKPCLGIEQDREAVRHALAGINRLTEEGALLPHIHRTFPFEQYGKAHHQLDMQQVRGRIALVVR